MGAGVPATVRVPGQDAVIAGAVARAAGQWQLDDSTRGPHVEAMLGARGDSWSATPPYRHIIQPMPNLPNPPTPSFLARPYGES